jgi:hypothetical protein
MFKAVGKDQHKGIPWDIGDRRFGDAPFTHIPDERRVHHD